MSEFDKIKTDADLEREFRRVDETKRVKKFPIIQELQEVCPDKEVAEQIIKLIVGLELLTNAQDKYVSYLKAQITAEQDVSLGWERLAQEAIAYIRKYMPE